MWVGGTNPGRREPLPAIVASADMLTEEVDIPVEGGEGMEMDPRKYGFYERDRDLNYPPANSAYQPVPRELFSRLRRDEAERAAAQGHEANQHDAE
jgi:hypothetical protein